MRGSSTGVLVIAAAILVLGVVTLIARSNEVPSLALRTEDVAPSTAPDDFGPGASDPVTPSDAPLALDEPLDSTSDEPPAPADDDVTSTGNASDDDQLPTLGDQTSMPNTGGGLAAAGLLLLGWTSRRRARSAHSIR